MTKQFIVVFDTLPIQKSAVRSGENPQEVVIACRSINVGLFVSGNLRRDTCVSIVYKKENRFACITFPGKTLRRVSPDERSIAFFLLKAYNLIEEKPVEFNIMDNGIILQYSKFDEMLQRWKSKRIHIANEEYHPEEKFQLAQEGAFIYDMRMKADISIDDMISIPRPPTPERFILDLNLYFDGMP
ncbi:MAG: hypothetical protein BAJATHORv1_20218 [Candidatus Thorarchaeota archaeon]|nr:MAG: hypothetical protein BAJATHORv1_20218 [Candidatus Thorarchaeota archaeon]